MYSALCYQPINKDAVFLFPLSVFHILSPSIPLSSTAIEQPIHLMQFLPLALASSIPPPTPVPLSLSLALAAQVMSFFFSWILLPPSSLALTLSSASH